MPHLDFDASRAEHGAEPITFSLAGRKLTCVGQLPFVAVADLYSERIPLEHDRLVAFLEAVVVDEDLVALHEALRDKSAALTTGDVDDVVAGLLKAYTGRPQTPSETSSPSPSDGGPSSKPDASSPAATSTA